MSLNNLFFREGSRASLRQPLFFRLKSMPLRNGQFNSKAPFTLHTDCTHKTQHWMTIY